MPVFHTIDDAGREAGVNAAVAAAARGELVVLPTDTVYGVGCDAFSVDGVDSLLTAKGRGREMPPPVLVPNARTVDGLAIDVPAYARDLIAKFWPGALTLVLKAQPSLAWDLGETNGTVAVRMPADATALALLERTGPLAVTSANLHGQPAALTCAQAIEALGAAVSVYLDGGPAVGGQSSTIVDCTRADPVILRDGALSAEQLRGALSQGVLLHERPAGAATPGPHGGSASAGHDTDDDTGAVDITKVPADGIPPAPPTDELDMDLNPATLGAGEGFTQITLDEDGPNPAR